MELKIAANAAVNLEVLRALLAAENLENVTGRELIDLAKIGGFVTVLVDQERLINELESLRQMDQEERLTAMIKSEMHSRSQTADHYGHGKGRPGPEALITQTECGSCGYRTT